MIFYFSGTGNSRYAALKIGSEVKEKTMPIVACFKKNMFKFRVESNEIIGFVTPVYFWGLPTIVNDFLARIDLEIDNSYPPYLFHLTTCGVSPGGSIKIVENYLKKKGLHLDSKFSVKMPDSWTPVFDLSDKEKVNKINFEAEKQIQQIIQKIKNKEKGNFSKRNIPLFVVKLVYQIYEKYRKTENFTVEPTCIGCKKCANLCPIEAIEIRDNKPVWVKDRCVLCLACLHHCPKLAIQYNNKTKNHGQYVHP
ncbi:MAG: EFR1 family ferrodoxin [Thermoplasmata archaeon]